jgi:hypothetical protein
VSGSGAFLDYSHHLETICIWLGPIATLVTGTCFFAKSTDSGKTLKSKMISAPNKGDTINQNTEISASGSNVYVTWWTNKTGTIMPVFRASNDIIFLIFL